MRHPLLTGTHVERLPGSETNDGNIPFGRTESPKLNQAV
jgi:hypothetical protein